MKDKNILISMGIIIYIVMSGIDRFVYHIPNVMYIPVAILGIALILIGFSRINLNNKIWSCGDVIMHKTILIEEITIENVTEKNKWKSTRNGKRRLSD